MSTKIRDTVQNAAVDAVVDLIDEPGGAGAGTGTIEIRTGGQPGGGPGATATGAVLATLTFGTTAFGSSSAGVATAAAIASDTSVADTNTAGYARIKDGSGTALVDMKVGLTGDTTAQLTFDSVSFIAGGTCAINSLTCTCADSV